MLQRAIVTIVDYCTRYAAQIIGVAALLGVVTGIYAAGHFAIDADVNKLISKELPWRQREVAFEKSFPPKEETILAVIDAPTSELATQVTAALIQKLAPQKDHFHSILEAGGGPFFAKNGLLFLPTEEVVGLTKKLGEAKPLIQTLAQDSNLRGLTTALNYGLIGARMNQYTLDDLSGTLNMVSDTLDEVIAGRPASFSWRAMLNGRPTNPDEQRRFVEFRPVLDYAALMPGKVATDAIRDAAAELDIGTKYGARVRLTGPVAIADEEYATLEEGAFVNTAVTIVVVLTILWLALRSFGIILAVAISLLVGLSITAAIGLAIVGALNLISVAFAVLFIGLGVDFGIQFSVRYRAERHEVDNLHEALVNTARHVGAPLTLAAAATAAGFLSFLPTDYKGLSELGLLAGLGMIIAFLTSITVIPALLTVLRPPGEPEEMGFKSLAPVDRFMERHRIPVIVGTGLVVAAGLPLLYWLQFDFNPLNLRSAKVESVATFLELRSDPNIGASSIYVLAPNKEAANTDVQKLSKVPEVASVKTIDSFIPDDQQPKLAAIRQLASVLDPVLRPDPNKKPPTDADNVAALKSAVDALKQPAGTQTGRGAAAAKRLGEDLGKLASGDEALRARAQAAMIPSLNTALDELRNYLQAHSVTLETLPPEIAREWVTQDGRYKVEILPKGDPTDNEILRQFARAVQAVEPNATGGPIAILESGRTVVRAFYEAGFWALGSIIVLLWIVLRRFGDVLLTIIPLLVAGVVTMELMVLFGMKLNFANIIALPLLLGVGVAFKIYYIMAWRAGQTDLLQSSLTRAVMFSALTTATAFGSLWLSSHPGTSSMGKLMALALVTTMAAAVLFQPVLMGPPREPKPKRSKRRMSADTSAAQSPEPVAAGADRST
ncbi:MAG TPA: MMPL family transporter [Xanthobacteraceae bacterium]|nr:MMPL family transporter [Xanthobacteraceae bacterium]